MGSPISGLKTVLATENAPVAYAGLPARAKRQVASRGLRPCVEMKGLLIWNH